MEMTSGLVRAIYSLPKWHNVKTDFLCTLLTASRGRTHTSPLVILNKYIRMTILFNLTPSKIYWLSRGGCHLDNPHVPTCYKYIRITILFSLTTFKIDLQKAGVTWTTHMSLLVISTSKSLPHLPYQHLKLTFKGWVSLGQPACPHLL